MPSYAKLFSSIVHSTIWREPNHVRLVWVTMLAIANKHGLVEASVPGLADAARVSIDECKAALAALEAPDPYSRTQDYDGRRIAESEGGWLLLNYAKYRALKDDDLAREKTRERVRRYRERHKSANDADVTVTPGNATVTRSNPIPETRNQHQHQHQKPENRPPLPPASGGVAATPPNPAPSKLEGWSVEAGEDYEERYGGKAPFGIIGKFLKPIVARHGWTQVRKVWRHYLATRDPTYATPAGFAQKYGVWLDEMQNGGGRVMTEMEIQAEASRLFREEDL